MRVATSVPPRGDASDAIHSQLASSARLQSLLQSPPTVSRGWCISQRPPDMRGSIGSAMSITYPYHSLEDFLTANMLTVDAQLDDGWGASFPVKGREIEATVLFADVTAFSARTADLDPTETLTFVNNFFCWITAEALRGRPGRAATSAET
jgi:hypothetical protein